MNARVKRTRVFGILLTVLLCSVPGIAGAQTGVPRMLSTQGRLMDSTGTLLGGSGTQYCFKFAFYDNQTVGSGSKLWPSGSPSTMTVTVRNGVYSVGIGDTNAGGDTLDYNFQDNDAIYLNVEVATKVGATCAPGDGAESFETLSPRQRIYASGYAINAHSLGGFLAAQSASGSQIPVLNSGHLYLGGTNPFINATSTNALTLQGGGVLGDIQFFSSANKITSSGNATFAGAVTAAGADFTTATSGTITVTGTASTSNLVVSNGFTFGTVSGILKSVAGVVTAALVNLANDVTGILGIANGGTGTSTAPVYGQLLVGNAAGGYDLVATSSLGIISGSNDWLFSGGFLAPTSTTGIIVAASSTIGNGTQSGGLTINGGATTTGTLAVQGAGTSTFANGIDIANGCFSINGECVTGGPGGGGSGVLVNIQVFTSDGTYTPSAGATNAQVVVTGGGGGGGGADGTDATNETVAGGGGAGATSVVFVDLTSTTSVAVFVGAGGAGGANTGTNGSTGATTSFSTFSSAGGGFGGTGSAVNATGCAAAGGSGTPGVGGVALDGDVNILGGGGTTGSCYAEVAIGGTGGSSYWGGGGRGGADPGADGSSAGSTGAAYGAGGGGASDEDSTTGATGGAGAGGVVVVYEYGPYTGVMGIDDGGTGTTTAPTYGQVLVGNASGSYDLVSTSSLNIMPTTTAAYTWTGLHNFARASSTQFSAGTAYFGATATTTIDDAGNVQVAGALQANGQTTLGNASTTNISATYASSTRGFFGSLSIGSLTGVLKATAGAIATALVDLTSEVTGILQVANGGTGWGNIQAGTLLTGNGAGAVATTTVGSSLQLFGGELALNTANANLWSALQRFANASSSAFSSNRAYFGATATTTIDEAGNVAVAGTLDVTGNATFSAATTTNLMVTSSTTLQDYTARNATSSLLYVGGFRGAGLSGCSNSGDKLLWNSATAQFSCGADAGGTGSGISSLGAAGQGQTGASQTFATSSDTNVGITVTSAGDTHTFATTWNGTLATTRGGTGWANLQAGTLLTGNGAGAVATTTVGSSLQLSGGTLALNLANANIWTGLQQFGNASSTMFETITHFTRTIQSTSTNALVLRTNLTATAGLTLGGTTTPQMLAIDTLNNRVTVGTGGASPIVFVLDTKNTGGDPNGVDGAEYYNSNTGEFRCYSDATWRTCGGIAASSTGDVQFRNADGSFTATANFNWNLASNGLTIKGNPGQTGDLFAIASSTGDVMLAVSSDGVLEFSTTTDPAASAGQLKIYAKEVAGRVLPKWVGPAGVDTSFQAGFFSNNIAMIGPGSGTTVTTFGTGNTAVGTVSSPTLATTNLHTSMRMLRVTSANTANAASELRNAANMVWRGNAAGMGGWFYSARFGINSTTANQRVFVGLHSATTAIATTQSPSALTQMIGVGWDSADTNLQVMTNDGSGTATKTDLGSNFPANNTTPVYEFTMFAAPNASSVTWRVMRLDTGSSTSGVITTDLPTNTTFLTRHEYMNNGGTAAAVVLDVMRVYIESDN